MKNSMFGREGVTAGIDMGDRWSRYAMIDNETGDFVEEGKAMTCEVDFRATFGKCKPMRVALEAGTHSPWASRVLADLGHEVLVANPRKLRLIYQSDKKNDKADARSLARVARMDAELLAPIRHRGAEAQAHLAVLRARDALIRTRTLLVNHVRGAVKSFGGRVPKCSTEAFPKVAAKCIPKLPLWPALSPLLDTLGTLTSEIKRYDREIGRLAEKQYAEAKLLRQVNGIGPVTALAFVLTLEDPGRFPKSRQVGAYLGLRPRQDESGDIKRQLRITKAGDEYLRRLLVGSAQYILGPFGKDCDLRRWGLELAKRGGKNAKKKAAVAVARKLAVLLHRLWVSGATYVPLRKASAQSKEPAA